MKEIGKIAFTRLSVHSLFWEAAMLLKWRSTLLHNLVLLFAARVNEVVTTRHIVSDGTLSYGNSGR